MGRHRLVPQNAGEIPADAKGNQFYLDFDGVMSRPKIYVNGELAGEWKYGYGSFAWTSPPS